MFADIEVLCSCFLVGEVASAQKVMGLSNDGVGFGVVLCKSGG